MAFDGGTLLVPLVASGSTLNRWHVVNGTDVVLVNVVPKGKNVIAYVGR